MVRVPCCENMGLKKGPWTSEEDEILISFIQRYGHQNWRALPKQAGLLRCGKSCRLRWINYLRPDIKRGNFTKEEEEAIVELHDVLGNRWSAIATRLPGRTDNEIKNFWHTHLKKREKLIPVTENMLTWSERPPLRSSYDPRISDSSRTAPAMNTCGLEVCNAAAVAAPVKSKEEILVGTSNVEEILGEMLAEEIAFAKKNIGTMVSEDGGDSVNTDMVFWYNLFMNACKSHES